MTIAINTPDFRSSTPFDPERWRRTYGERTQHAAHVRRPRRGAPRREFTYGSGIRLAAPHRQGTPEQTTNLVTLIVAALLTALVVIGLVAVADFASGGGTPSGFHVAAAVAGTDGGR